jgi:hypothetical protein
MLLKICVASGRRSSMNAGMLLIAPSSTNKFAVRAARPAQPRFDAAQIWIRVAAWNLI